ncbi:AMP-binding protein [Pseudofrankia sp. BMG5.36]|uniref:AMP-binding protein n=1 Tax=Pseudofrankia sp. BMG5.36 TaxID=1834512 RepID=UPI0008D94479|nr:AMP-binding protein [Pseudofrankia sp. BMG5.36]OHV44546.1 hypothetical protein BCD48_25110 [Pseudofrankia sp. BMG5.36]
MSTMSFGRAMSTLADEDPDRPAVTVGAKTMTRSELEASSNRLARMLADLGVHESDLVTLALPNGPTIVEATLAILKLGATPQPVSPRLPGRELAAIVELADSRLVIGVDQAVLPDRQVLPADLSADESHDSSPLPDRVSACWKAPTSGGSTGRPKLILDGQPALIDPTTPFGFGDRVGGTQLVTCPMYHNAPFGYAIRGLLTGNHLVVMPRFDAEEVLRLVERHRADWMMLVPTMMNRIWRLPESVRTRYDLGSLRRVWHMAGPCAPWLKQAWIDWLGPERLWELYGSTEQIAATVISGTDWLTHRGSVGRPLFGEVRVRDRGVDCPPDVVGEIWLRSPGGVTTFRYLGAEASVDDDGWQTVGDLGWLDEDGFLYLSDRRVDMIVTGGQNVYPAEVEAALDEHPAVVGSAVVGLPDTDLGHRVHAVVQVGAAQAGPAQAGDEPAAVDEAALRTFVADRVAPYKVPRSVEFVTQPLRDEAGKIRRSAIREARIAATAPPLAASDPVAGEA